MDWNVYLQERMEPGRQYRRAELVSIMKKEKPDLAQNSYVWILGNLVNSGLLCHEGRDQYHLSSGEDKALYTPNYSESSLSVKEKTAKKYPRIGFTVFESILLNEFLNHQIARNTIFVQAERDVSGFVFDFFREEFADHTILFRPSAKDYSRYWRSDSIIVTDLISEAPVNSKAPHDMTVEKLLVDIFCDKIIRMCYSEAEYKTVVCSIYEKYQVDTVRLLRYAGRRNKKDEIAAIVPRVETKVKEMANVNIAL